MDTPNTTPHKQTTNERLDTLADELAAVDWSEWLDEVETEGEEDTAVKQGGEDEQQ